jgi:uncharacterized protein YyaL (SSP411 family)
MERESFESEEIAALMNRYFVCIKVDREERPDLDDIYMKAVQAMTGSGGWPMSLFLTPDLEPFYGGTYFPPTRMYGRPGFPDILQSVADAWSKDRERIVDSSKKLVEHINSESSVELKGAIDPGALDAAFAMLAQNFDSTWGGFGDAPKFPHAMDLRLLLRAWLRTHSQHALEMVTTTLDRMMNGGVYDQLGGGFHRYSTDERWLVPHFEKMLYDNALLVPAYLEAYLATKNEEYARIARECCDWTLREMTSPEGGFASTQDADSEGEEGRFFVWTPQQLSSVLGAKHGAWAAAWYGVTDEGNFEHGASVLWRQESAEHVAQTLHIDVNELARAVRDARTKLFEARKTRIAPRTDDKILAAWNGLMISALAQSYQVLGDERFLAAAQRAAKYVLSGMRQDNGALFATARHGRAHLNAYLDDYAFVVQGLIDLYESDFDSNWIVEATKLEQVVHERFEDGENGGFFTTSNDHERLIARLKSPQDGALPSGNGVHALNLLRLAELTGKRELAERAQRTIVSVGGLVNRYPAAFAQLLQAVDFLAAGPREVVIAGERDDPVTRAMLNGLRSKFLPQRVVALSTKTADPKLIPLLESRPAPARGARAFVCRNYACKAPVETSDALLRALE